MMTDATLLAVSISIGFLRGLVAAIAGMLVLGVVVAQVHLSRRQRAHSKKKDRRDSAADADEPSNP